MRSAAVEMLPFAATPLVSTAFAKSPLRVSNDEMAAAWDTVPRSSNALSIAAAATSAPLPNASFRRNGTSRRSRSLGRPARAAARRRRLLCSRRALPAAVHVADDRHSRPGGGRRANRRTSPETCTRNPRRSLVLGVTEFYRIGGAQAIAALAYGTETILRA